MLLLSVALVLVRLHQQHIVQLHSNSVCLPFKINININNHHWIKQCSRSISYFFFIYYQIYIDFFFLPIVCSDFNTVTFFPEEEISLPKSEIIFTHESCTDRKRKDIYDRYIWDSYQADRRHLQGSKQQQHPHAVKLVHIEEKWAKNKANPLAKATIQPFSAKQKQPLSKRVKSDMRYIPRTELHHLRNLFRSNSRDELFILAPSLFTTPTPTPGLHLTNWDAGAEPRPSSPGPEGTTSARISKNRGAEPVVVVGGGVAKHECSHS